MKKPLHVQPRRGHLLLTRALFFAIFIVRSCSCEDPSAPLRSHQAKGPAAAIGSPLPEQDARALHSKSAKTTFSKSSSSKSGKGNSKSKAAKAKASKSKASKSKAANSKASKSKAAKSKAAKAKAGKAKSKSVSSSDRSKSGKGKAEKSETERPVSSKDSVEYFRSKSMSSLESTSADTEIENVPSPAETETSASTDFASAEINSMHQVDVEDNHDANVSVGENYSSNHPVTQGAEETGTTSPDSASSPLHVTKTNGTDVDPGDFKEEKVGESHDDILHAHSADSNVSPNDNVLFQEGVHISKSGHEISNTSSGESIEEQGPNLEYGFDEGRIKLDVEDIQNLEDGEAVLDSSRESVE
eukprot:CAMPEP_0181136024 /NCGR_PEP_ID=MMETSP1071-20121207/32965_1 /TAXON_ID=35127 /ORGANISM="Thalassiosira sp., Strain NH16" /LENGTH=357 /DNA_ID=CAMNT_0023222711 /DNA_START=183 /DNA_END=1256 /DNA_ORIENTATION=+